MSNKSTELLSSLVTFTKYAKYLPEKKRRENWTEIIDRYVSMMIKKYPELERDIKELSPFLYQKKVLASMRFYQFSGLAIEVNESRGYNCSFTHIDSIEAFSETMYLLLGGTGCGYSVQKHHVEKLPVIEELINVKYFTIPDNIEGWADSIKVLLYEATRGFKVEFDYSLIRTKGTRLKTAGGKAPGPDPLIRCHKKIYEVISRVGSRKLTTLECHDILCHIADAVLSGGIRRSAMISLFSKDDEDMLMCKSGEWWMLNPQRARSNNSVILLRETTTEEDFKILWEKVESSGAGEPGFYWTNDLELGTNPCGEVSLRSKNFCNLTTQDVSDVDTQVELNNRSIVASFFGTLQAGFTDFKYLRPEWKTVTEEDALIGVSMTGIASGKVLNLNLKEAADLVKETNKAIADIIGINPAARCTVIKPEGTASCVVGSSSGIHAYHSEYYIRTLRLNKIEAIAQYLLEQHPNIIEDDVFDSNQIVVSIPIQAPVGSITRDEDVFSLLERIDKFNTEWVREGHRSGNNTNNVSATVSINKDNFHAISKFDNDFVDEWGAVGRWMWINRDRYNGLSVLPFDNGTYQQAPFQSCTKERYEQLLSLVDTLDIEQVKEEEDVVDFGDSVACGGSGGSCDIK